MNVKQANIKISVTWKTLSKELFDNAKNESEFIGAVIWTARHAHVLRSWRKQQQVSIAKWFYDHLQEIKDGTYDLFAESHPDFSKRCPKCKFPTSLGSKICHIINPRKYPIIWDSHIKGKLKEMNSDWHTECAKIANSYKSDLEIYKNESGLWATDN